MGLVSENPTFAEREPQFDEQPSVLQKLQKWGDYDAYGDAVAPTKFVPMKTPLGSEILDNWNLEEPPQNPLTISILQKHQQIRGRRIGMIIDLSNHDSLYGIDLKETGIQYERVPLVAKIFPAQQAVNKVVEKADRFWGESPNLYIGIHCAYGFNRTGFVLCSYLVQVCNYSVQEALESFALARPPGIRHEQFISELHKRYSGWKMSHPIAMTPSFSELRGFASYDSKQRVDSLQSDFLGVAEHLHDNHPSIAGRVSGVFSRASGSNPSSSILGTQEEVLGSSPPLDPSQRPPPKGRAPLAGSSTRSLQPSNCESVNNESLDLDERDIYQHFARRQELPKEAIVNGHHRRPALKAVLPAIGSDSVSSTASPSQSTPSQKSPFASAHRVDSPSFGAVPAQEDEQANRRHQNGAECQASPDATAYIAGSTGPTSSAHIRAPISARVVREDMGSNLSDQDEQDEFPAERRKEHRRPCTIM